MIETRLRSNPTINREAGNWRDQSHRFTTKDSLLEVFFLAFNYRVNGKVFTEYSTEFEQALNEHLSWSTLNDSV